MSEESPKDPYFQSIVERSLKGADDIARITEQDAARLPESAFVSGLLPVLANRSGGQALTIWQDVAGHAMRPIDVVDPSGDVLFRVPPILSSDKTHFSRNREESTGDILALGEKKSEIHPRLGSTYVWEKLQKRIVKEPVTPEDVKQWDAILKRYGYEGIIKDTAETQGEEQKEESVMGSFSGEYDEL